MPPDVSLRFNFKHGALDVDVVSLTGTHQGAVRSKDHGRLVIILGLVCDSNSLHDSPFMRNYKASAGEVDSLCDAWLAEKDFWNRLSQLVCRITHRLSVGLDQRVVHGHRHNPP
jgi:hypothetical protein